ncbi:unnamed protein product [Closterium sp. Naga37s-1]|nr:unnamed protein product [Closterium sp. Naga37s-1]
MSHTTRFGFWIWTSDTFQRPRIGRGAGEGRTNEALRARATSVQAEVRASFKAPQKAATMELAALPSAATNDARSPGEVDEGGAGRGGRVGEEEDGEERAQWGGGKVAALPFTASDHKVRRAMAFVQPGEVHPPPLSPLPDPTPFHYPPSPAWLPYPPLTPSRRQQPQGAACHGVCTTGADPPRLTCRLCTERNCWRGGTERGAGRGGKLWEIEAQRAGLPVVAREGEGMEAAWSNNAVCCETGSGKTFSIKEAPQVSAVWGEGQVSAVWGRAGACGVGERAGACGVGERAGACGVGERAGACGVGKRAGACGVGERAGACGVGERAGACGVGESAGYCGVGKGRCVRCAEGQVSAVWGRAGACGVGKGSPASLVCGKAESGKAGSGKAGSGKVGSGKTMQVPQVRAVVGEGQVS